MHRHQILGLIKDMFDGKSALVVVSNGAHIHAILDDFDRANGWFNDGGSDDFKVYRANGSERIDCVGNTIRFVDATRPSSLRGWRPDVIIVDRAADLPTHMIEGLETLVARGAEQVPLLY